jgi:hypothetical protein
MKSDLSLVLRTCLRCIYFATAQVRFNQLEKEVGVLTEALKRSTEREKSFRKDFTKQANVHCLTFSSIVSASFLDLSSPYEPPETNDETNR